VHYFFRVEENASIHIKHCSFFAVHFSFNGTGFSNEVIEKNTFDNAF